MAERKSFLLRLDPEVYEAMARWADDELRSVNAQIGYALRLALRTSGRPLRRDHDTRSARDARPGRGDRESADEGGG